MKKVININFQGRILPIEELAFENLKEYIQSLRVYFNKEEGRDEIINDIECRIAELCEERLKKGSVCISEMDINLIIQSIGRPADFEAQDGFEPSATNPINNDVKHPLSPNEPNHAFNGHKRLYRDESNKFLGGVCAGIANYFSLDPLLVRILWFFLIGVNVIAYVILWIAVPSSSVKEVGGQRKRLFRDIDNKFFGGVCAGLAKYFGIRVLFIRLFFIIPLLNFTINFRHLHLFQFWEFSDFPNFFNIVGFSSTSLFIYIVMWLVLPEAKSSADKLEMVGEKVDLNSIKNTIQNDMEGFGKRAQNWGSQFYKKTKDNFDSNVKEPPVDESTSTGSSHYPANEKNKGCLYYLGRFITICIKVFVYFIIGIILISVLAALFGLGLGATSLLPLKNFLLEDGIQSWYLIGIIICFFWVPVIGIVSAIIRRIAGIKKSKNWIRISFWALWALSLILIPLLFSGLAKSFSKQNTPFEQNISLTNAKVNSLEISLYQKRKYYEPKWYSVKSVNYLGEDTLYVRNLHIRIVQSKSDSFELKVVKLANGKSLVQANELAQKINFSVTQLDSILYLDKGIAINKTDKFRNQQVIMTIAVPIGKRIKISNSDGLNRNMRFNQEGIRMDSYGLNFGFFDGFNNRGDDEAQDEAYYYENGVQYLMTPTGLEKIKRSSKDRLKASDDQWQEDENGDSKADDMEQKLNNLKKEREKLEREFKNKKELSKAIIKVSSKLDDLQWVIERFTY